MVFEILRGTTTKPVASEELIASMERMPGIDGQLIIGYPNLGGQVDDATSEGLWLSPTYGAVLFDLVEGREIGDYQRRQEDILRLFKSRLLQNRNLVKRGELTIRPEVVTFAPSGKALNAELDPDYPLAIADSLPATIGDLPKVNLELEEYLRLQSACQNLSAIRRARTTRVVGNKNSRGARLLELENSIATMDSRQHKAVIETIDGVQRIRGLAGSGKTIILALKAAYLHGRHPEWKIAITFYTRALKEQFKRLITTFCVETGIEPDWDRIHIINAWGGRGGIDRTGIYKQFCDSNEVTYFDFRDAAAEFGRDSAFSGAVNRALAEAKTFRPIYDVILVDEAQDFPPEFLRMCYEMLGSEHRLVYAYDELQNLNGVGLPDVSEIFGMDGNGKPRVSFEDHGYDSTTRRDIVLEKCYRNSRPVLVTAHGLGFGIYRKPPTPQGLGLVQMFDQPDLWYDIGYFVEDGDLVPGSNVTLMRSDKTSPRFLEAHSSIDDLIEFHVFTDENKQYEWVTQQIAKNLSVDELRHDDIMVINPNPFTARKNVGHLRECLYRNKIDSHVAGVDMSADVFFAPEKDSITFTGINRAKGNEAGMVYIVNAQEGTDENTSLAVLRNRLFTAITRSKAWVRVCGVGPEMEKLAAEFARIKEEGFALNFRYPTEDERKLLRIVHREKTPEIHGRITNSNRAIQQVVGGLKSGEIFIEDLSPDLRAELARILTEGGQDHG